MRLGGNDDNLREAAGAFGDLGTLIPFLVGYLTIARMDPVGVLVAFGFFKVFVGLMGLTGAVTLIARLTSRPIVQGLILGLGLAFIVEGVKLMEGDYLLAIVALALMTRGWRCARHVHRSPRGRGHATPSPVEREAS